MGDQSLTLPPGFNITAEVLCTAASTDTLSSELDVAEAVTSLIAQSSQLAALPALFSVDPGQSLLKRTQLFSSAKDLITPAQSGEAIPLACTSVNVSGSGSFGDVTVGSSSSTSFTISNPCSCPVNYFIAGAPYGFFLSSSGGTISANGSISVSITFRPPYAQSYSGSISVAPGGGSIFLSGRGVERR